MVKKKTQAFKNVTKPLGQALDFLAHLEKGIHTGNIDVDAPEVYNGIAGAKELLDESLKAIHEIEDIKQDEAMEGIPNLDTLFAGNPVNEYVDAILAVIAPQHPKDGINMFKLLKDAQAAMEKLAESQRKAEEVLQKVDKKADKPKTEEEFLDQFVDSLDLAHEGMIDYHKESLRDAFAHLDASGYGGKVKFLIPLKKGNTYASLYVKSDYIAIQVGEDKYEYNRYEVYEEEYSAEEAAVEPVPCPEEAVVPCTCDDKSDCSKPCERDVMVDLAIAHLTDKKTFTGSDYDLIRYFLRVVEGATDEDLQGLSNRALELAWKRHWYLKTEDK